MVIMVMHGGGIAEGGGRTRPAIECAATLNGAMGQGTRHEWGRVGEPLAVADDDDTPFCLPARAS